MAGNLQRQSLTIEARAHQSHQDRAGPNERDDLDTETLCQRYYISSWVSYSRTARLRDDAHGLTSLCGAEIFPDSASGVCLFSS